MTPSLVAAALAVKGGVGQPPFKNPAAPFPPDFPPSLPSTSAAQQSAIHAAYAAALQQDPFASLSTPGGVSGPLGLPPRLPISQTPSTNMANTLA
jgi:hypothetical protein